MSSFVQHFSDGSLYGCLDDFFGPHEYGYIKLESIDQWYNLSEVHDWKKQVMTGENFLKKTKGLTRVHGQAPKVEEVKENKEPDMAKLMDSEMRRVCLGETNTSILEKLRSDVQEIENRYKKSFEDTNDEYYQGGLAVACKILGLLTSLETPQFTPGQEEPVPPSDKGREQYIADWGVCPICGDHEIASSFDRDAYNPGYDYSCSNGHSWSDKDGEVQPQFTPGQEIEVSDDGMDWVHGKFVDMYRGQYRVDNTSEDFPSMRTYWDNARHKEESPEIVVTEVKPSERIRQIADEKGIPNNEAVPAWIIASYLDEQALSRQKPTK